MTKEGERFGPPGKSEVRRREILLASAASLVADDLGWQDVGFHGSDIQTPNFDRLAETGARFDEFYVQPMCRPTRAAPLAGRCPLRHGLQLGVIPSGGRYGLADDEFLLPRAPHGAGYETALVGKWHLGRFDRDYWPCRRGCDHFYGSLPGEIDHFTQESHGVSDWYCNNTPIEEEGYDTTLLGDEAVRLISAQDPAKPLFLYLAFTAPHAPRQAPEAYVARCTAVADPNRRAYAAVISAMDDQIGRVAAALEAKATRDNSLVVFHSDNGDTRSAKFTGDSVVEGPLPPDNGTYRVGKGALYEGSALVGAVANWPGRSIPGHVPGMPHVVDIYPTLLGLAGERPESDKPLDGLDVWATISTGAPSPRTEIVCNVDPLMGAVREGATKLTWLAKLPPASSCLISRQTFTRSRISPEKVLSWRGCRRPASRHWRKRWWNRCCSRMCSIRCCQWRRPRPRNISSIPDKSCHAHAEPAGLGERRSA
ncbi:MAG TPA: arylsulfatase [Acetobacteraceae bacterium]|nr:arylsulfatase [Acetobacteraceae bacterium]